MNTGILITRTDLEQALPEPSLRSMQMIHIAVSLGPVLFAIAVNVVNFTMAGVQPTGADVEMMTMMSVVHAVFALSALMGSEAAFRWLTDTRRSTGSAPGTPRLLAAQYVNKFRSASIVRLAMLEGAAFFGLVVCVIGLTRGVLEAEPLYWLNMGSTLVLIVVAFWKFPTREQVISTLSDICSSR
jgi:hypothetical protein